MKTNYFLRFLMYGFGAMIFINLLPYFLPFLLVAIGGSLIAFLIAKKQGRVQTMRWDAGTDYSKRDNAKVEGDVIDVETKVKSQEYNHID